MYGSVSYILRPLPATRSRALLVSEQRRAAGRQIRPRFSFQLGPSRVLLPVNSDARGSGEFPTADTTRYVPLVSVPPAMSLYSIMVFLRSQFTASTQGCLALDLSVKPAGPER